MIREIKTTGDGSKTLFITDLNEGYHSHHGALQEAKHVFIENGLKLQKKYEINILEMGFGTGLNVLVTLDAYLQNPESFKVNYYAIEKYPVSKEEIEELNYSALFDNEELQNLYFKIHAVPWNSLQAVVEPNFYLNKIECDFFNLKNLKIPPVNLVYYDCFGARVQPDLWEKPLFDLVADKMEHGGILTTYSSKGSVRRILQELDFNVEKRPGPPGKREMLVAFKN